MQVRDDQKHEMSSDEVEAESLHCLSTSLKYQHMEGGRQEVCQLTAEWLVDFCLKAT